MSSAAVALPPLLFEGDHLGADDFLRIWETLPELKYAELIDGVVFLASPLGLDHGTTHYKVIHWLSSYSSRTPGLQGGTDTTWVMGSKNVPQPDIFLRILPEYGGQSGATKGGRYAAGAPELIIEITGSSHSRDLGAKKELYRSVGVREYLTVELNSRQIVWRELVDGAYHEIAPDARGVLRSSVFPGLWLQPDAVWEGNLLEVLEEGLRSSEHAAFVQSLNAAYRVE
jgi:Uma2 family endonuclease